ncbi:hypothetical protein [Hydrogenimonas urashimensis]|uniref:hypothetical protein n=1 Tax=Hydrogenimonas urashimensis TaxID=2740515 RepID=UPI0019163FA2|nr:hypothetical protein [Hydrogenimonas urashimensis]
MSIAMQTEAEATQKIIDFCSQRLTGHQISPLRRDPDQEWGYLIHYAVIIKDGGFDPQFISDVYDFCVQSDGLFEFGGTTREISDLDFETLIIVAKVTP